MTVTSTTSRVDYDGDGLEKTFEYTFKIFSSADLVVVVTDTEGNEVVKTLTTDYSVTGVGREDGGEVIFVTAPTDEYVVTIYRSLELTQETDYTAGGSFPAQAHENALDRLTYIDQQLQAQIDRSIKFPVSDGTTLSAEVTGAEYRANKYLAFDGSGNVTVLEATVDQSVIDIGDIGVSAHAHPNYSRIIDHIADGNDLHSYTNLKTTQVSTGLSDLHHTYNLFVTSAGVEGSDLRNRISSHIASGSVHFLESSIDLADIGASGHSHPSLMDRSDSAADLASEVATLVVQDDSLRGTHNVFAASAYDINTYQHNKMHTHETCGWVHYRINSIDINTIGVSAHGHPSYLDRVDAADTYVSLAAASEADTRGRFNRHVTSGGLHEYHYIRDIADTPRTIGAGITVTDANTITVSAGGLTSAVFTNTYQQLYYDDEVALTTTDNGGVSVIGALEVSGSHHIWGFDSDVTLAANSNNLVATQKATKQYVISELGSARSDRIGDESQIVRARNDNETVSISAGGMISVFNDMGLIMDGEILSFGPSGYFQSGIGVSGGPQPSGSAPLTYHGELYATKVFNAVWNDVADFQPVEGVTVFGKCYFMTENAVRLCHERCQTGIAGVASDTFGQGVGMGRGRIPIAISGWVLAYVDKEYEPGTPLVNDENGNLTAMTDEEWRDKPFSLVGLYHRKERERFIEDIAVLGRSWVKVK